MVNLLQLIGKAIFYTFMGVFGLIVAAGLVGGIYGAFSKLFKEIKDGIKNRKKNKKQFWISVCVICWFFISILWVCELFL